MLKYTALQQRIKIHALHNFLEFMGAFSTDEFGRHGRYYDLDELMFEVHDEIPCDMRTIKKTFKKMYSEDLFSKWNSWYCELRAEKISKEDQIEVNVLHDMKLMTEQ